jgi:hypothetical protein
VLSLPSTRCASRGTQHSQHQCHTAANSGGPMVAQSKRVYVGVSIDPTTIAPHVVRVLALPFFSVTVTPNVPDVRCGTAIDLSDGGERCCVHVTRSDPSHGCREPATAPPQQVEESGPKVQRQRHRTWLDPASPIAFTKLMNCREDPGGTFGPRGAAITSFILFITAEALDLFSSNILVKVHHGWKG